MPFLELKKQLAQEVATILSHPQLDAETILNDLSAPPNPQLGHLALPCFRMGKALQTGADKVAQMLCEKLSRDALAASAAGPYANFRWHTADLYQATIPVVLSKKDGYGSDGRGRDQTVVIEYCAPNIAKRLGFQHIRTTLIGHVLANIYKTLGFRVERINFVGDWGSQFARLLAAFSEWGDAALLNDASKAMDHLMEVYVRFHKELDLDPSWLDKANGWLKKLEENDPGARALWKTIRQVSVQEMERTLSRMNVRFDHTEGESAYIDTIAANLELFKQKAGAKLSDGAWIVEIEGLTTPALIQKRDGTTLYLTRDIAAAIDRFERFHFAKMLYVVSDQQKLHFQQLFGTLKKMGHDWSGRCSHIGFGTVLFGSQKMSTREGRVILLDDLLIQARELALKECAARNPDLTDKESAAETVGIGAVIFGQLSSHRTRDIEFNWEQVLALDGDTGAYVQYAAVRCRSLLKKAQEKKERIDTEYLGSFAPEEDALICQVARFRGELVRCLHEDDPFYLTSYLIDLAHAFNRFYFRLPVLQCTDDATRAMRLSLVQAAGQTLENGLRTLNISCPSEM